MLLILLMPLWLFSGVPGISHIHTQVRGLQASGKSQRIFLYQLSLWNFCLDIPAMLSAPYCPFIFKKLRFYFLIEFYILCTVQSGLYPLLKPFEVSTLRVDYIPVFVHFLSLRSDSLQIILVYFSIVPNCFMQEVQFDIISENETPLNFFKCYVFTAVYKALKKVNCFIAYKQSDFLITDACLKQRIRKACHQPQMTTLKQREQLFLVEHYYSHNF